MSEFEPRGDFAATVHASPVVSAKNPADAVPSVRAPKLFARDT
jgi:hypothetical protein